jgi:hypothetical protein
MPEKIRIIRRLISAETDDHDSWIGEIKTGYKALKIVYREDTFFFGKRTRSSDYAQGLQEGGLTGAGLPAYYVAQRE